MTQRRARHHTRGSNRLSKRNGKSIDWHDYFSTIAQAVKERSKDSTKVGAVIVRDNVVLSTGYNGFARGVREQDWRKATKLEKLTWTVHAEQNAIFNAARLGVSVVGATIYTTKFPCLGCVNAIVQSGIATIYTPDRKLYNDRLIKDDGRRTLLVLTETNVKLDAPNLQCKIVPQKPSANGRNIHRKRR